MERNVPHKYGTFPQEQMTATTHYPTINACHSPSYNR